MTVWGRLSEDDPSALWRDVRNQAMTEPFGEKA